MNHLLVSLLAMLAVSLLPLMAWAAGQTIVLTLVLPYLALALFLFGFIYRVLLWGRSPVPFRITVPCGQQKSLPWIKWNPLESPACSWGAIGRMLMEVLFFRSLFRNARAEIIDGRPVYLSSKWLWLFAMLFHWSLLVVLIRHLRFFLEPVPAVVNLLAGLDGFFKIGLPTAYLSTLLILGGLTFLLLRRLLAPRLRYLSFFGDYFVLFLLLGIVGTGILIRHFFPVDLMAVKNLALGWVTFNPVVPDGLGLLFYLHLFYVSLLLIWFPWSKLMHLAGVFLSPTRNLPNDNRVRRHLNPWNAPVKVHSYEEYEDDFREQMKEAGLPVEKE